MIGNSQKAALRVLRLFFKTILSKIRDTTGFHYNWLPYQKKPAMLEKNAEGLKIINLYVPLCHL